MTLRVWLQTGVAVVALGVGTVQAQEVTPAQKAVLEAQMRSFYMLGATAPAGKEPWTITAAGDHFDVVAPVRLPGPAHGEMQVTATAKVGDGGRMMFRDVKTTVPFQLVVDMPVPPKDGEKGPAKTVPVTYVVNAASQDGSMDYDPSFATASNWSTAFKGMTVSTHGSGVEQTTTIGQADGKTSMTPMPGNLVDLVTDGILGDYVLDSKAGQGTPAIMASIAKISVAGQMNGVSRDRVMKLIEVLQEIGKATKGTPTGQAPKTMPPAVMKELTGALQGLASAMNLSETFDGVKMNVGGTAVGLDQVKIGLDGKSDRGLVHAAMDMGFSGLALPDMGLGDLQKLIPHQVDLRPYVGGVSTADLVKLLDAANEKREPSPAEMTALFSHGGVETGLESMSMDVGGTNFSGNGKLMITSPQAMTGTAQLTAEHFDALVQTMQAIPMAQQVMPAVIFLKGIGKADGEKLVWNVSYDNGKVLVNNIDLSALTGGASGGSAPGTTAPGATAPGGAAKGPARPQTRTR